MNTLITYEEIRNSYPKSCRPRRKTRKLQAWQGLLYFAIIMTVLLLFGGLIYIQTGSMYLESLTEQLFFLASAVLFVLLMGGDLREVFPLKKPKAGVLGGVLVFLIVSFLAAEVFSLLTLHFAPESLEEASESIGELFQGPSLAAELFLACLCPAVCEEAVHRGVILNSLRNSISNKCLIVVLGGLLFGLFHIYPVRMIMPAFLGMIMSWLLLQTENMLYGCVLHFGYNAVLILLSQIPDPATDISDAGMISSGFIGLSVLTAGIFIPFLLHLGTWLVRRDTEPRLPDFAPVRPLSSSVFLRVLIPTGGIILLGLLLYNGIV